LTRYPVTPKQQPNRQRQSGKQWSDRNPKDWSMNKKPVRYTTSLIVVTKIEVEAKVPAVFWTFSVRNPDTNRAPIIVRDRMAMT